MRLGTEHYHFRCAVERARSIKNKYEFELLQKRNVIGVGVGFRHRNGLLCFGEICICVNVIVKKPEYLLSDVDVIPRMLEEAYTDVNEVGIIVPFNSLTGRYRPAMGGVSIGHFNCGCAGTLGGLITIRSKEYIVSCNHVIALENRASIGDPIVQPGPLDGGSHPLDTIGYLEGFIDIRFGHGENLIDAAVATPLEGKVSGAIYGIGVPIGIAKPELRMTVNKCGRTTGVTTGIITELYSIDNSKVPSRQCNIL